MATETSFVESWAGGVLVLVSKPATAPTWLCLVVRCFVCCNVVVVVVSNDRDSSLVMSNDC